MYSCFGLSTDACVKDCIPRPNKGVFTTSRGIRRAGASWEEGLGLGQRQQGGTVDGRLAEKGAKDAI